VHEVDPGIGVRLELDGVPLGGGDVLHVALVLGRLGHRRAVALDHPEPVVERDGAPVPEAAQHEQDVVDVAPAQRRTIEFEADADPGIYLLHCHKVSHAMNGNSYPGGMVGGVVYEEAMDSEIFAQLMDYAGYEG
jgi:hypothetical protein